MAGGATPLSNRDVASLLNAWGFEEAGFKGGHMVMKNGGRQVQISAPSRHTPTPYKALRKAARILGISLKELLAGPRPEVSDIKRIPLSEPVQSIKEEQVVKTVAEHECDTCGKSFPSARGLNGHRASHIRSRCENCGKTFSQTGIGSHRARCLPKKRGAGRPRKPIAEVLDGRRTKVTSTGVEVPESILEDLDDSFPDPEAFVFSDPKDKMEEWRSIVNAAAEEVEIATNDLRLAEVEMLLNAFFPSRILDMDQVNEFLNWVEASKALFDSLYTVDSIDYGPF